MGRHIYRLVLLALGAIAYSQGYLSSTVFFGLLLLWSFVGARLKALSATVSQLRNIPAEHNANSVLLYTFSLERVFASTPVEDLFYKLDRAGKAPATSVEAWQKLLLASYARKYAPATTACEVRFNIKNNLLFVNGEVDFGDHLYHELVIPYRWAENGEPKERAFLTPECEAQLTIRVLVVNGTLRLEVGRYDKAYSPKVLQEGGLAVYETFAAVTTFPLIYFGSQHHIPVRYLNLVGEATPSYKASHARADKDRFKNRFADWRRLQGEIAAYRALTDWESEQDTLKLEDLFAARRKPILTAEGYTTDLPSDEEWRYPDLGQTYWNSYGTVFFRNMNANADRADWFTDYYEELP